MQHDTIGLMAAPTRNETQRARSNIEAAVGGIDQTPEGFAVAASITNDRRISGQEANWTAALVRLERAERARPADASPLTTIDRARQLTVDMELQAYAGKIVRSRSDGVDIKQTRDMPLDREMGETWASDMRVRLDGLSTPSLVEYASGKGVTNARDAVLIGSTLARVTDVERTGDSMIAAKFGIERTRGLRDRLAGRSEEDVRRAAPAEERKRMMEIEDKAGLARNRGPADTVGPRRLPPMEYHLAVHGTERHTAHFLAGGEALEKRIAVEKAALRKLDDKALGNTFAEVMPRGSIPGNATDRDRWIDSALRNEQMIVAASVASSGTALNAVMRPRGETPEGPGRVMPTGSIYSSSYHKSQEVTKNLEFVPDNMLRKRFGKVHGMDHMAIPEAPEARRSWIHQASMLSIAADHQPHLAAGFRAERPSKETPVAEQVTQVIRARPAAMAAMAQDGRTR